MKPLRLTGQKYLDMLNLLDNPQGLKNFLRMEKWIFDSPDQAGEAFRQFIKWFYQENRLIRGDLEIGGRPVRLTQITHPVFNVYATQDHLVPPAASLALGKFVKSRDYSEFAFKGGHIGIYVSGRAQKEVPAAIGNWLKARM
jgi:polyhydroxyalkanoate synthase